MDNDCSLLTGVCDEQGPTGPAGENGYSSNTGSTGPMVPLERLERGLQDLLQLSRDPLGSEVKQGTNTQDPQGLDKPGFKDGMAHQVLAEQPEQRRPSQAQQGWQERLDRLVTQPARQEP